MINHNYSYSMTCKSVAGYSAVKPNSPSKSIIVYQTVEKFVQNYPHNVRMESISLSENFETAPIPVKISKLFLSPFEFLLSLLRNLTIGHILRQLFHSVF